MYMKIHMLLAVMLAALLQTQEVCALTIQLGSDRDGAQERSDRRERRERRSRRHHHQNNPDVRRDDRSRPPHLPDLHVSKRSF